MLKYFKIVVFIFLLVSNLLAASEIKEFNGLKYYFFKSKDSEIGAINILVRAGSIFDPKGKYGTAYLLAKMLKKGGTKKFTTDQLLDKLDETGIEFSTSCDKDFININFKFIKLEEKNAFDILEQIMFYPSFDSKQFKNVKKETIGEIISYENNNDYLAIHQGVVALIENSEYSHSSFGNIQDIENITVDDLKNFYKKYFFNKNMIVSFAGNIDNALIKKFIENNFTNKTIKKTKEIFPKFSNKSEKIFKQKDLKQSYIYILFPSIGFKSSDYYSLKVLSFILGGNLTSILAEKIRKEEGLAYSVFSTNYTMINKGFFVIGMQTENRKREEAIKSIINILKELKSKGIDRNKLNLAKNFLIGKIPISLQYLSSIAFYISKGIYLNKSLPPWKYDIQMYKKVTTNSVNNTIKKIFDFNKMIISIVGKNDRRE